MIGYLLIVYLVFYFGAAFLLPSYRVWKRTGVNPVTFGDADTAHDYIGKLFKIVMTGLIIVVVINSFMPNYYSYLLPKGWLESPLIRYAGTTLLLLSLVWTVLAQLQMGNSWRIGLDERNKTTLVQSGVFLFSRNPIFLGMITTLAGVFLIIPSAMTLLFLVLGVVLIQIQVRLEEEFLLQTHGADYEDFRRRVRRWL